MYRGGGARGLDAYNAGASAISGIAAAYRQDIDEIKSANLQLTQQAEMKTDLDAARNLGVEGLYQGLKPKMRRAVNRLYSRSGVKEWDIRQSNKIRSWMRDKGFTRPEGWKPGGWKDKDGVWRESERTNGEYRRENSRRGRMASEEMGDDSRGGGVTGSDDMFHELPSESDERTAMAREDSRARPGGYSGRRRTPDPRGQSEEKSNEDMPETKEEDPIDEQIRQERNERFDRLQLREKPTKSGGELGRDGIERYGEGKEFQDDFMKKNYRSSKDEQSEGERMGGEDFDARDRESSRSGDGVEESKGGEPGDDIGSGGTAAEEGERYRMQGEDFRSRSNRIREGMPTNEEMGDNEMETFGHQVSQTRPSNTSIFESIGDGTRTRTRSDIGPRPKLGKEGQRMPTDYDDTDRGIQQPKQLLDGEQYEEADPDFGKELEDDRGGQEIPEHTYQPTDEELYGEDSERGGGRLPGNTPNDGTPTEPGQRTTGNGDNVPEDHIPTETPMEVPGESTTGRTLALAGRLGEKAAEGAAEGTAADEVGTGLIAAGTAADATGAGLLVGVPLQIIGGLIDAFGAYQTGKSIWNWFDQDILGHHPKVPQQALPKAPHFSNSNLAIPSFDSVQDVPTSSGGW